MSDIKTINLNGNEYDIGGGNGFTDDIKNALTICMQNVAWKNGSGDLFIDALVNAMNSEPLEYTGVCENYEPNGASFSFGPFTIDFENGDYIEAVIDTTDFTIDAGMLLSVGTAINTWGGWNWHISGYPTGSHPDYDMSMSAFAGSTSARDSAYELIDQNLRIIKITEDNMYLNNMPVFTTTTNHDALVDHITPSTAIYIGSTQGSARSNALYKYIRIYRGAESDLQQ